VASMSHTACLLHADGDDVAAAEISAALEKNGIRCWSSPNDLPARADTRTAPADVIGESEFVIALFSASADVLGKVRRGLKGAAQRGIPAIGICIEAVTVSESITELVPPDQIIDISGSVLSESIPRLMDLVRGFLRTIHERVPLEMGGATIVGEDGPGSSDVRPERGPGAQILLTVEEGSEQGRVFLFSEHETFIVGRGKDAHFRIADKHFSRHHFVI